MPAPPNDVARFLEASEQCELYLAQSLPFACLEPQTAVEQWATQVADSWRLVEEAVNVARKPIHAWEAHLTTIPGQSYISLGDVAGNYTVGDLLTHFRLTSREAWKIRRVVDALRVEIPRVGQYRLIPATLLPSIEAALRKRDWLPHTVNHRDSASGGV
jgi:hypothetical protein